MMARCRRDWNEEPALEELMTDPVLQALMACDQVIDGELRQLLSAARLQIEAGQGD
jgi:hypothetical protein